MYITEDDILNYIAKDDLDAALGEGYASMENISRTACSTVRNYLYQRYRIDSEYAREGEARNAHLVMIVCDISLYILFSGLPGRLTDEDVRKLRYDAAIRWLEQVAQGKVGAGIASLSDPEASGTNPEENPDYYNAIRYGSQPKMINEY